MFKAITPPFIKRTDNWLVQHHPVVWTSRIHYSLWHGFLLWALSAITGLLMPINITGNLDYELWYFLFTVLGIVILCFWTYNYEIFNKEKNYGKTYFADEYKNFSLAFLSVALFLTVGWPFEIIYNSRVAKLYTDEEVIADINTLNTRHPYLAATPQIYYNWTDTVSQKQYFTVKKLSLYGASYFTPYTIRQDSLKYGVLTDNQIYRSYVPDTSRQALLSHIREFRAVAGKYGVQLLKADDEIASDYISFYRMSRVEASSVYTTANFGAYELYSLVTVFNNLCRAKFLTLFIFSSDALWSLFYFVFTITLLLLLYRITHWRQFLITLVVLVLYPLLMFILSELIWYRGMNRSIMYQASLLAAMVLGLLSFVRTIRENKHFLPVSNIFNQLFYISLPFFFLFMAGFLDDATNLFHRHDLVPHYNASFSGSAVRVSDPAYQNQLAVLEYEYWRREYERWRQIAKYGGIFLFVFLLPFTKRIFVKQMALPRKT